MRGYFPRLLAALLAIVLAGCSQRGGAGNRPSTATGNSAIPVPAKSVRALPDTPIFTFDLGKYGSLAVTRTKVLNTDVVDSTSIGADPAKEKPGEMAQYSVNVDLIPLRGPRATLANTLEFEMPGGNGFHVLQALRRQNEVILVVGFGPDVGLWRIDIGGGLRTALCRLDSIFWSASDTSVSDPLKARVEMIPLGGFAQVGGVSGERWMVRVTGYTTTLFMQESYGWSFVNVLPAGSALAMATIGDHPDRWSVWAIDPHRTDGFSVYTRNGWSLEVRGDGGGTLGCGDVSSFFNSGTFSYQDVAKQCLAYSAKNQGNADAEFFVAFTPYPQDQRAGHPLNNPALVKQLFETAHKAAGDANVLISGSGLRRLYPLDDIWEKNPPGGTEPAKTIAKGAR